MPYFLSNIRKLVASHTATSNTMDSPDRYCCQRSHNG